MTLSKTVSETTATTISTAILAQNIQSSANFLGSVDLYGLKAGQMENAIAESLLNASQACLTALASAFAEGMNAEDTVFVSLYWRDEPQAMPLAQVQAWCLVIRSLASERLYRPRIQQALRQATVWLSEMLAGGLGREQAVFAAETGERLLCVLRDAQAAGVTDRMTVKLNGRMVALPEVRDLAGYVAAADSIESVTAQPKGL